MISELVDRFMFMFLYDLRRVNDFGLTSSLREAIITLGVDRNAITWSSPPDQRGYMDTVEWAGKAELHLSLAPHEGQHLDMLQLTLATPIVGPTSLFDWDAYDEGSREALVSAIGCICAVEGFDVGFAHMVYEDESNESYQQRVSRCFTTGQLDFAELLQGPGIGPAVLCLGSFRTDVSLRSRLRTCPAWRIEFPKNDTVCVFLHDLAPNRSLSPRPPTGTWQDGLSYLRTVFCNARESTGE